MSRASLEAKAFILPPLPKPSKDEVPGWAFETEAALNELSVVERTFVEHMASGCNHSEAYRRATKTEYTDRKTDYSRTYAYRFLRRPRVMAALRLTMKDVNFDGWMDRAWILQRLEVALEKAEEFSSGESAARIIYIIAKVKGELLPQNFSGGGASARHEGQPDVVPSESARRHLGQMAEVII